VKKGTIVLSIVIAAGLLVAACAKSEQPSSTSAQSETAAPAATAQGGSMVAAASLPIPAAKLPMATVAAGNASAGAAIFTSNCESCHGAKAMGGGIGPKLAGSGLKAGQVAFMILHPQAIDKSSAMPQLNLTAKQIADVSAYVASLK